MNRQKREVALRMIKERAKEQDIARNKYAAGGSAKIRKDVATKNGAAITPARNKGRSRK